MHITRRLIAALQVCKTKEELEDTFMLFHVTNMKQKQRYLLMAMGNPQVFFTPEIPTLKHSYCFIVEQFLSGNWRYAAQLKKALGVFREQEKPLADADIRLLEKLNSCNSQEEITHVFDVEHISGLENRIAALRRVMQATVLHSIPAESTETLTEDYEFECAVFLDSSWRNI